MLGCLINKKFGPVVIFSERDTNFPANCLTCCTFPLSNCISRISPSPMVLFRFCISNASCSVDFWTNAKNDVLNAVFAFCGSAFKKRLQANRRVFIEFFQSKECQNPIFAAHFNQIGSNTYGNEVNIFKNFFSNSMQTVIYEILMAPAENFENNDLVLFMEEELIYLFLINRLKKKRLLI